MFWPGIIFIRLYIWGILCLLYHLLGFFIAVCKSQHEITTNGWYTVRNLTGKGCNVDPIFFPSVQWANDQQNWCSLETNAVHTQNAKPLVRSCSTLSLQLISFAKHTHLVPLIFCCCSSCSRGRWKTKGVNGGILTSHRITHSFPISKPITYLHSANDFKYIVI